VHCCPLRRAWWKGASGAGGWLPLPGHLTQVRGRINLTLAAAVARAGVCSCESEAWKACKDLLERAEGFSWGSGGVGRAACNSDDP